MQQVGTQCRGNNTLLISDIYMEIIFSFQHPVIFYMTVNEYCLKSHFKVNKLIDYF